MDIILTALQGEALSPSKAKEDAADKVTAKASIGKKIAINPAGFNINDVRQKINTSLKAGAGSLKLTIVETPAELEENPQPSLHLKGQTLLGAKGQYAWTVGDNHNCDIIIPKAGICFGTSFVIVNHDGKHYFKECSDMDVESAYMIKLGKVTLNEEPDVVNEIVPNDIISFFNNTLYVIKNASNNEVDMSLVKEIAIETGD